ncbi:MAG: DEAD/DEAH box helicase [Campylobacterota bacterium]
MPNKIEQLFNSLIDKNDSILREILNNFENEYLKKLLNHQELNLLKLLDGSNETDDVGDVYLKLIILNQIGAYFLEGEKLKRKYLSNEGSLNELLVIIYEMNRNCSENCQNITDPITNLFYTCSYGIIVEKDVEVSTLIKRENHNLVNANKEREPLVAFENNIIILFLYLIGNPRNNEDKQKIKELIQTIEKQIENLTQKEYTNEELIKVGVHLSAFTNILYILKEYFFFLFHGKCSDGDKFQIKLDTVLFQASQNIKNYSDLQSKIILMRYTLKVLHEKSVWNIASTSPLIKSFFEKAIKDNNFILNLMPSQSASIHELLSAKKAHVVSMPTSSGKTLLAELYLLYNFHINRINEKEYPTACYIVPTNALVNQVKSKLDKELSGLNINIESALPFYDIDEIENEIFNQQKINILVSTPEKIDFLIRENHPVLQDLKVVIVDEAHNIADKTRGSKFELLLATLKQRYESLSYMLLTPFINKESGKNIAEWLGDGVHSSDIVVSEWSPSKQFLGYALFKNDSTQVTYLPSARNTVLKEKATVTISETEKQVKHELGIPRTSPKVRTLVLLKKYLNLGTTLVLCEGISATYKNAILIRDYLLANKQTTSIAENEKIKEFVEYLEREDAGNEDLIKCVQHGIAYHNSTLSEGAKDRIEQLVALGHIKVICATTTLAQGMNFPITNVFFQFHTRQGGARLVTSEFMNIAGRAGRAYYDTEGHIILLQPSKKETEETLEPVLQSYIQNDAQEVISSLTDFFETIDKDIEFNLKLLDNDKAVSNFLQYLNHISRVVYDSDYKKAAQGIGQILNASLVYRNQEFKQGFLESQQKIQQFSKKYLEHISGKRAQDLKLADISGISDISLTRIQAKIIEYKTELKSGGHQNTYPLMDINNLILKEREYKKLSRIIGIINSVPELRLEIGNSRGKFKAERIALMTIGWVNGNSVSAIARAIKENIDDPRNQKEIIQECQKYINSNMKNFLSWGTKIYKKLTDHEKEKKINLPSYIYFGVSTDEAVILSRLGVPRFQLYEVQKKIKKQKGNGFIKTQNIEEIKELIFNKKKL